ncbi:MAG: hypothetical protein ABW321_21275, partial [Polyangiales bacterium]
MTGRVGRSLTGQRDLDQVIAGIEQLRNTTVDSDAGRDAAVHLRRQCLTWLRAHRGRQPKTTRAVHNLLFRAHDRFKRSCQARPRLLQTPPPIPRLPSQQLMADIQARAAATSPAFVPGGPAPVGLGNAMRDKYVNEMSPPHWTPKVYGAKANAHQTYQNSGGTLGRLDWQQQLVMSCREDDPTGEFFNDGELRQWPPEHGTGPAHVEPQTGVVYLATPREREPYRIEIDQTSGRLYTGQGAERAPFDTQGLQVDGYGYGWGMFVLGPDNFIYAHSEIREIFHHSSFFAGGGVQCAGEICCIDGRLRFLTGKAGHYRPGKMEFYRLLGVLRSQNVDLSHIAVVPEPKDPPYKWYSAAAWFNDN